MTQEEKFAKIKAISKMILELKQSEQYIQTKQTIQKLQQEIDNIVHEA
jgi:hypothetical protein